MKTKEQIRKHLNEIGYTKRAALQISGFLLGQGLIQKNESALFVSGEHSFDDFYAWFIKKEEPNIFAEIACALEFYKNNKKPANKELDKDLNYKIKFLMDNKDYLKECIERKKELSEKAVKDVDEVVKGLSEALASILG